MPLPSVHNVFKMSISLVIGGAVLLGAAPAFAIGARANYVEVASWETGYQAQYTITNDGPGDVTRWRVIFDLPAGSSPSSTWDSVRSGSGQHLIFDNAAWNGTLAPGASTSFGFVVVGLGRPVGCTVNGGPCDTLPPFAMAPHRGPSIAIIESREWRVDITDRVFHQIGDDRFAVAVRGRAGRLARRRVERGPRRWSRRWSRARCRPAG
jgi:hypothetical protein